MLQSHTSVGCFSFQLSEVYAAEMLCLLFLYTMAGSRIDTKHTTVSENNYVINHKTTTSANVARMVQQAYFATNKYSTTEVSSYIPINT